MGVIFKLLCDGLERQLLFLLVLQLLGHEVCEDGLR